jgi:amidohydrolase
MTTLLERARGCAEELIELRRDLHRNPELSFRETRTASEVARRMEALGLAVQTGIARTGVIAEVRNGDGPTVVLRADMDALPIREANETDYRSLVDGVMHACGHDAHVAILAGAARLLRDAQQRGELPAGTVRLLFQPSEEATDKENKSGARRMIDEGAMRGASAVFGVHVGAHLPLGKAHVRAGAMMAGADMFSVTVEGRSAHAGSPDQGIDAIVLAAHIVLACQNAVARRISPVDQGVLSIGVMRGGVAENVLAERVMLQGTLRYFREPVRGALHRELRNACSIADALGGHATVEVRPGYPPLVNDQRMSALATAAFRHALGEDAVVEVEPFMWAEDFALYLQEVPGCFVWLGAALDPPREHHHPRFDIDETVLPAGAAALATCAMRSLSELRA